MKKDNYIKFISKSDDSVIIVKVLSEQRLPDLIESFKVFAISVGYSPKIVEKITYDSDN